jgi:hypothetical protein
MTDHTIVWLVSWDDYDNSGPRAAFTTEAAAEAAAARWNAEAVARGGRGSDNYGVRDIPLRTDDGTTDLSEP